MPTDPGKKRPKSLRTRPPAKQVNDGFVVFEADNAIPLTPEQRLWPLVDFGQNPPQVVKPRGVDLLEWEQQQQAPPEPPPAS